MKPSTINRLDKLINMKATGSPDDLAQKLGLTKRQVFNCINYLKEEFGAPIAYSKERQSYVYTTLGRILCKWEEK